MADAPESAAQQAVAGLVAEFDGVDALKVAAAAVRRHGFTEWDVHSPYPIHGIDRAMGIRRTPLPWLVLFAGLAGGVVALAMQWWMNAVDYPLVISGKPLFGLPAAIPVAFELIVLFSALATFVGTLGLTRLPQFSHFLFGRGGFERVTTDGLFISIAAGDPKFDAATTPELLESLGATAVEICHERPGGRALPGMLIWALVVLGVLALVPPLLVALVRQQKSDRPRIHLVQDMDFSPAYGPQSASPLFSDGRAMRPPLPGTVARGELNDDDHFHLGYRPKPGDDAAEPGGAGKDTRDYFTTFPPRVRGNLAQRMERGRGRFAIYCATCHGLVGSGDGMTAVRAIERQEPNWATPTSLHAAAVRAQPVGELFHTITNGAGKMPAYASQVPVEDRWAIVLYVRALQRSQNAGIQDVPKETRDQLR